MTSIAILKSRVWKFRHLTNAKCAYRCPADGRVLILQRGRVVYFGANGSALREYFGQEQLQVS